MDDPTKPRTIRRLELKRGIVRTIFAILPLFFLYYASPYLHELYLYIGVAVTWFALTAGGIFLVEKIIDWFEWRY